MKKAVLNDREYASKIYCETFGVDDDEGDCNINGTLCLIESLQERERLALELRYRYHKTLEEVGKNLLPEVGNRDFISGTTTGNILKQIFRRFRSSSQKTQLSIRALQKENDRLIQQINLQMGEIEQLKSMMTVQASSISFLNEKLEGELPPSSTGYSNRTPIEMIDFSVRTFNCLKRAGINRIEDILSLSYQDLCLIRNLDRSKEEVIEMMKSLGFVNWAKSIRLEIKNMRRD